MSASRATTTTIIVTSDHLNGGALRSSLVGYYPYWTYSSHSAYSPY